MVTKQLALAIYTAACDVPVKFVCSMFGVNWNTARDIDLENLKHRIDMVEPVAPNAIGVDEVSYQKRHNYLTLVTDADTRRLIFVTTGRRSENLAEFFTSRIDPQASKWLEAASIDMWDPYEKALRQHAPHAMIVYDKFHLIRMVNECVDQVRREQQNLLERQGSSLLKHQRFLFLRGQEKLSPDQQQTLAEILKQNEPMQMAYILKEQFWQLA